MIYKLYLFKVFTIDISKQLMEYGVEYHVLQEELSSPSPEMKKIKYLEEINKTLMEQNKILHEQLEVITYLHIILLNVVRCCKLFIIQN